MVKNQIGSLTPDLSFGHNLCFQYPNVLCKPIFDIYFSKKLQLCKEFFNPMSFNLCNCPLKIWKFTRTLIPKVGAHLGVFGFIPLHSPTFPRAQNVTYKLHFWPTPLQALALVVNLRLWLWHELQTMQWHGYYPNNWKDMIKKCYFVCPTFPFLLHSIVGVCWFTHFRISVGMVVMSIFSLTIFKISFVPHLLNSQHKKKILLFDKLIHCNYYLI